MNQKYPEFSTDVEAILKAIFESSKREAEGRSLLVALQNDGFVYIIRPNSHFVPTVKTLHAVGLYYVYEEGRYKYGQCAGIYIYTGALTDPQYKPSFKIDGEGKLCTTSHCYEPKIEGDSMTLSKELGLFDEEKNKFKGFIVQDVSWIRQPNRYVLNLIIPAEEIIPLFEKCLPQTI